MISATTEEVLRAAAEKIGRAGDEQLALELVDRADRFERLRAMGQKDRRRGFALPLAWVNYLDGAPDATAALCPWAVPQ